MVHSLITQNEELREKNEKYRERIRGCLSEMEKKEKQDHLSTL